MTTIALKAHYDQLYLDSVNAIAGGNCEPDARIDDALDSRRGLTLVIRPPEPVLERISGFIEALGKADPGQYYYPDTDIHITVMSLISCYEGFSTGQIKIGDYTDLISKSISGTENMAMHLKGITASPSAVMVQGFPSNENLEKIRNSLKINFRASGLEQSIDRRYTISAAHATAMRFRQEIADIPSFLATLERYRHTDFGTFDIRQYDLVSNDWYQKKKNVEYLYSFPNQI